MIVGILGGGQLGRMLALAGLPMGLRFRVLDPNPECPAAIAAEHICGEFDDYAALAEFVRDLDVVTYEFENVPMVAAQWLAERVPVQPPPRALDLAQDRLTEKDFFHRLGVAVPTYRAINNRDDLTEAIGNIGLPAVLKTRRFGYDGKGQMVMRSPAEIESAWEKLGGRPLIWEQFIDCDRELSLIAVRAEDGATVFYPLVENVHRDGILRRSIAPAEDTGVGANAQEYVERALNAIGYVGVLAVEFFECRGQLSVNEMAPRVHNSGHWTIEACATSQFANHLRAIVGWPLGDTTMFDHAAMINLIGDLPDRAAVMNVPGVSFHDYGKSPRPNRKVGHLTVTAPDRPALQNRLQALAELGVEIE